MICIPLSVAFVSVHCTRRAVFPTPQLCFRRVMACACDHTPRITSTEVPSYFLGTDEDGTSRSLCISLRLHNHNTIATEGSPKSRICPTLIE